MAVLDFRPRRSSKSFQETLAHYTTIPAVDYVKPLTASKPRKSRRLRRVANAALCLGLTYGSYHLFYFAKQLQYNLMIFVQ